MSHAKILLLTMIFMIFVLLFSISTDHAAALNIEAVNIEKYILSQSQGQYPPQLTHSPLGELDCDRLWLEGVYYNKQNQIQLRDETWKEVLNCSENYLSLIRSLTPINSNLGLFTTQIYPNNPAGWFWLADSHVTDFPEQAVHDYLIGLHYDASDVTNWRKLSDALVKLDPGLAKKYLTEFYPENMINLVQVDEGEPLFLWARVTSQVSPDEGLHLYEAGLKIHPEDGFHWREYGDVLVLVNQPEAAIDAYLQSCYHGDPGSNGCYRAGLTAEGLGDFQDAIRYYRLSKWSGSLERAARLESQVQPKQ